jgi:hypothetical protein
MGVIDGGIVAIASGCRHALHPLSRVVFAAWFREGPGISWGRVGTEHQKRAASKKQKRANQSSRKSAKSTSANRSAPAAAQKTVQKLSPKASAKKSLQAAKPKKAGKSLESKKSAPLAAKKAAKPAPAKPTPPAKGKAAPAKATPSKAAPAKAVAAPAKAAPPASKAPVAAMAGKPGQGRPGSPGGPVRGTPGQILPTLSRTPARSPVGAEELKLKIGALYSATSQIKALKRSMSKSFYEIGRILSEIQEKKLYEVKGYGSFDSFVEREIDLGKQLSLRLVRVTQVFIRESALSAGLDRSSAALAVFDGESDLLAASTAVSTTSTSSGSPANRAMLPPHKI